MKKVSQAVSRARDDSQVANALAVATCSLLGAAVATPAIAQEAEQAWSLNTSLLYYGESDDRVQDISLSVLARRLLADERQLSLGLTVDSLTGASPSGAIALDRPQTFTSPSGNAVYTTSAGEVPLDDTFLDTRVALTASWTMPFGEQATFNTGVSASLEYDYLHLGVNASIARDFYKNNTTLGAGLAFARDSLDPEGGVPVGLSQMLNVDDDTNKRSSDEDKDVIDVLLGVTQVISRNALFQLNYSFSDASGYLTDPFKFISVVDPVTGDTLSLMPATSGPDGFYRYENRPDSRTKHSLFGHLKYYFGGQVLDASYRFMTDDWDIDSHTLDVRYRIPVSNLYIEPHFRYYTQTEADFYRSSLVAEQTVPEFASSDYRLGDFDAITAGVKIGKRLESGSEWSVRIEYYMQDGDVPGDQIIGNQANRELYPDLDALIAQFSYRFGF